MRDVLTDLLAELETQVSQVTRLVPAADVRRRGDRRQARIVWTAVAATVVALTGGLGVVLTGGGGAVPGLRTDPTTPITVLPAQVMLPRENDPGWQVRTDRDAPAAFQPCSPGSGSPVSPEITLTGRTDARTASGPIAPRDASSMSEQVLLYASADLAAGAIRELADAATACGWSGLSSFSQVDPPVGAEAVSGYTSLAMRRVTVKSGQGQSGQPGSVFELALVRRIDDVVVIVSSRHRSEPADATAEDNASAGLVGAICAALHRCDLGQDRPIQTPTSWPTPPTEAPE